MPLIAMVMQLLKIIRVNVATKIKVRHLKTDYDLGFSKVSLSLRNNTGTTEYVDYGSFVSQDFDNQVC
jgi:hypothetical protein